MLRRCSMALVLLVGLAVVMPLAREAAATAGPVCAERLVNGGFEQGTVGWQQSSAGAVNLISDYYPRSGTWGAYLAGDNRADDKLAQQIILPATAVSITLTVWWAIATEEPGVGFDQMTMALRTPEGALLTTLLSVDSSATVNLWQPAEADLTMYRGQTVILQFHATTDGSNVTDFYVDDVSLVACLPTTAVYLPMIAR